MLRSAHVSAVAFALLLAGPAAAQGLQTVATHPAELIDISALAVQSDFTVFMHEDVPADVRRAALRRLWTLIDLPQSCMDLCREAEPAVPSPVRFASDQRPLPVQ